MARSTTRSQIKGLSRFLSVLADEPIRRSASIAQGRLPETHPPRHVWIVGRLELVCAYPNPVVLFRDSTSFGVCPRDHDLPVNAPNGLDDMREPDEFPEPEVCRGGCVSGSRPCAMLAERLIGSSARTDRNRLRPLIWDRVVERATKSVAPRTPRDFGSWRRDSNPQPADYKSAALPVELRQH